LKKFYHSLTFNFSNNAREWILNRYKDRLTGNIGHNTDLTQYTPEAQAEWRNSIVGQELNAFLNQYGCDTEFGGINVFMCTLGNPDPHIDTKADPKTGAVYRIRSRLNVMVMGNPYDPLIWWGSLEYDDPRIVETKFLAPNGREYTNKSVPGHDTQSRYEFLGAPELVARNVYTPSAFVKTDCAHTVHFTPGPRLIVTVALDKSIEELVCLNLTN
jgi:hypothetical protein